MVEMTAWNHVDSLDDFKLSNMVRFLVKGYDSFVLL